MIVKKLGLADVNEVFDAFNSVALTRQNCAGRKYGFYEYNLTGDDFRARLSCSDYSFALRDRGKIIAYMLAYPLEFGREIPGSGLSGLHAPEGVIYSDQLFANPRFGLHVAGQMADLFMKLAYDAHSPGIVTAIPQKPWKNIASTRLALARGFRRRGIVQEGDVGLGIFTNPLLRFGRVRDLPIRFGEEQENEKV